ncbi:DNA cytosine methyltransferase [Helicobacter heilmannii]|uniref:DNA cytosine methyltransferase n=1 Tax=Helicobacter heilmannii TaxID=35817 RepID=UPI000CF03E6C|nr:DNA cytosine methyltransferase [Helicobacter heilmannii]
MFDLRQLVKFRLADIFCGAGGLSYGFAQNPLFDLVWALDHDSSALASYQSNHKTTKTICKDIAQFSKEECLGYGSIDVLLGGPPCQSYSTLGKRQMDTRAHLFQEYLKILAAVHPKIFLFENVVGLLSMQGGKLFHSICACFAQMGYQIYSRVLNAMHFGVPQIRQRVILVGVDHSYQKPFVFPKPTHEKEFINLRLALDDLPQIKSGESGDHLGYKHPANNPFLEFVRDSAILCEHTSPKNNPKLIQIMEALQDGQDKRDLPPALRPQSGYANTYAKMYWEQPAPTITRNFATPSSSRCIHPRDSRALSIREGARLQSFPDSYIFCGNASAKRLQIGNAVPPLLSISLAQTIGDYLQEL